MRLVVSEEYRSGNTGQPEHAISWKRKMFAYTELWNVLYMFIVDDAGTENR